MRKIASAILSVIIIAASMTTLFSCNDKTDNGSTGTPKVTESGTTSAKPAETTAAISEQSTTAEVTTEATAETTAAAPVEPNTDIKPLSVKFPTGLKAEKIGTAPKNASVFYKGGLTYKNEDNLYGIMSLDGKTDTGAKYEVCRGEGIYFNVTTKAPTEFTGDISILNCSGLVDVNGKELIPEKYASISVLNDRFAKACEVTEIADNKDDALVYYSDEQFSFSPDEDDTYFNGNWYIYDLTTGEKVKGATGTQAYSILAKGNYITFYTDDEEQVCINAKGEALPEKANLYDNGYYSIYTDDVQTIYDTNDNAIFTVSKDAHPVNYCYGDYLIGYNSDTATYLLYDMEGNIVSATFSNSPMDYNNLILIDEGVCDFAGNMVYEGDGSYLSLDIDEFSLASFIIYNESNEYTFAKADGTVIYKSQDEGITFNRSPYFSVSKEIGEDTYFYSLKDGDFTIEGTSFAPWTVNCYDSETGKKSVVDTISGKTIIDGYNYYSHGNITDGSYYVYATGDNGIDIYIVTPEY